MPLKVLHLLKHIIPPTIPPTLKEHVEKPSAPYAFQSMYVYVLDNLCLMLCDG
jgi:hypothetical protein